MQDNIKLILPQNINFESASQHSSMINNLNNYNSLEVDLSETRSVHVSFIGSLLDLKNNMDKKGGSLKLNLSDELKDTFSYLDLNKHFETSLAT